MYLHVCISVSPGGCAPSLCVSAGRDQRSLDAMELGLQTL